MSATSERPITLTIAAMGGQGGGVVQNWMIDIAERAGYLVQGTSVPGVAQRTGATIYYLEFFPDPSRNPVMALMPAGGACDLIVASELAEAARMVQRGLVDKTTTLVTSSHRSYTIDEKSHLQDGRADAQELMDLLRANAARLIALDMAAIAAQHGAVISAAMLGAIAGSGVLAFTPNAYRETLHKSGRPADIAAFEAAFKATLPAEPEVPIAVLDVTEKAPLPFDPALQAFPAEVKLLTQHGIERLRDYQDDAYVKEYLGHLHRFLAIDTQPYALTVAVARGLAVWMSYEDTIRVADLKTRPERLQGLLSKAQTNTPTVIYITEFMKPRIEEIAGSLPAGLGRWLLASRWAQRALSPLTQGLPIRSSNVFGYLLLRAIANLKPWRRYLLRHHQETHEIHTWLGLLEELAATDPRLAAAVAECQELVAGYGDTHARGLANFKRICTVAMALQGQPGAAEQITALRAAAVSDEQGDALTARIAEVTENHSEEAA